MKKIIILQLLIISCSVYSEIKFERTIINDTISELEPYYDFQFSLKNISPNPVKITDIRTSCGCMVVSQKEKLLQPDANDVIKGRLYPGKQIGRLEKSIWVHTDNIGQREIELGLSISILPVADISPKLLLWRIGDTYAKSIRICVNKNFHIKNIIYNDNILSLVTHSKSEDSYILNISPKTKVSARESIIVEVTDNIITKSYNIYILINK